jgi:phosphoribosylformylglycinamidine cyclo-ligase
VLIASTDGVGTKLLLASSAGRHGTVGADLVNHCVNDVLTAGADPLFFLDYVATGVLEPRLVAELVSGMAQACRQVNCALLGGETAEMPGMYQAGTYDIAGFMVGICERDSIIDGTGIREGDALLALPSTGLHTNGYSLARRVIPRQALGQTMPGCDETVLDALLAPHRAYLEPVRRLREQIGIKGLAHITGGGIVGNLPRILPLGLGARIQRGTWPEPPIFSYLAPFVSDEELWRTFNMGVGMVVVVDEPSAQTALDLLPGEIFLVGDIVASEQRRVQIVE